jgi:hypothetical protein
MSTIHGHMRTTVVKIMVNGTAISHTNQRSLETEIRWPGWSASWKNSVPKMPATVLSSMKMSVITAMIPYYSFRSRFVGYPPV